MGGCNFTGQISKKLNISNFLPDKLWPKSSKAKCEPKKIILSESISTAARRCLIQVLPVLTSIAVMTINIRGVYIGIDIPGLNSDTINLLLLQLAAKVHEMMIVASLSEIILQVVRHELLFGDGLPLGLIGSGLSFSDLGFFFGKEFYGAVQYLAYRGNKARKLGFLSLLIVSGVIAVLAGPISAVLLQPKTQPWPAGGTDFFLAGSTSDFWPSDLSSDISDLQQHCGSENSTSLGICPAGGFFSLWDRWDQMNYTNFIEQSIPSYAKALAGSRFYWPVHSHDSSIPSVYVLGDPRPDANASLLSNQYTWLVQSHAASAAMLQRIATDWWAALQSQMGVIPLRVDDRNVMSSVRSVISAVRCADPQNISASDTTVQFPTIQFRWVWADSANFDVDSLNTRRTEQLRFHWVHLPDSFGTSSIGAVFETPWVRGSDSRVVVGCTAQTGWVPTDLLTDSYSFWSGWYPWNIQYGHRTPSWTETAPGEPLSPTNGRIALGDAWLGLLTPPTPIFTSHTTNTNMSTIESILENVGLADITGSSSEPNLAEDWQNGDRLPNAGKTRLLEAIICSVLADGLSRYGSHRVFNIADPNSKWSLAMYNPRPDFSKQILNGQTAFEIPDLPSSEFTTIHADMLITGYSYRKTLLIYLCMVVLMVHMTIALSYILWVLIHKRTSRSWNSVTELIALSQNSPPAFEALKNTGAGITWSKSFARMAKIRVRPLSSRMEPDHVELVFEDFGEHAEAAGSDRAAAVPKILADVDTGSMASFEMAIRETSTSNTGITTALETNDLRKVHRDRGSWTFPVDPNRAYMISNVEPVRLTESREELTSKIDTSAEASIPKINPSDGALMPDISSPDEALIPRIGLPDGADWEIVVADHSYS